MSYIIIIPHDGQLSGGGSSKLCRYSRHEGKNGTQKDHTNLEKMGQKDQNPTKISVQKDHNPIKLWSKSETLWKNSGQKGRVGVKIGLNKIEPKSEHIPTLVNIVVTPPPPPPRAAIITLCYLSISWSCVRCLLLIPSFALVEMTNINSNRRLLSELCSLDQESITSWIGEWILISPKYMYHGNSFRIYINIALLYFQLNLIQIST